MKLPKNYNEDDILAKLLMLYFAFEHGAIGMFFIFSGNRIIEITLFHNMSDIMPMQAWGIILMISAAAFVLSVLQEHKIEYWSMLVAGVTGMVMFSIISMASMEFSINQTNTVNYIIIATIDMIVSVLGGVALWLRRTM